MGCVGIRSSLKIRSTGQGTQWQSGRQRVFQVTSPSEESVPQQRLFALFPSMELRDWLLGCCALVLGPLVLGEEGFVVPDFP